MREQADRSKEQVEELVHDNAESAQQLAEASVMLELRQHEVKELNLRVEDL